MIATAYDTWYAERYPDGMGDVTMTAFVVAAIEEKLARPGHGITTRVTTTAPAGPVSPPRRTRKPRGDTAPVATFTAPLDSPNARIALGADPDCPHPNARILRALCKCGTYLEPRQEASDERRLVPRGRPALPVLRRE